MNSKFITSLLAAGVMLVGTSAFALTDAQKAAINNAINGATPTTLAAVAVEQLKANSAEGGEAAAFIVNAAKAKMGPTASIASVRALVSALVAAVPTMAPAIANSAASAFPGMKANIAAAANSALATAQQNGAINASQANAISTQVNQASGVGGQATGSAQGGSLFQANQSAAAAAARTEFQRNNQNNYAKP